MLSDEGAHEREYLAAIAGMPEHTMPPALKEPAVGDFVSGRTKGKTWSGQIEWFTDGGLMAIDVGGGWVFVPTSDITH